MSSQRYEEKVRGVEVYTTMEPCMSQTVEYRGLVVASKVQALLPLVQLLHYCALIGRELYSDATLRDLLCHKEPAQGIQSPLLVFRLLFMA